MIQIIFIIAAASGAVFSYHQLGFDRHVRFTPYALTFALGLIALLIFAPILAKAFFKVVRKVVRGTWIAIQAIRALSVAIGRTTASRVATLPTRLKLQFFAMGFILKQNRRLRVELETLRADHVALNTELKDFVDAWGSIGATSNPKPIRVAAVHAPFTHQLTIDSNETRLEQLEFSETTSEMPEIIEDAILLPQGQGTGQVSKSDEML